MRNVRIIVFVCLLVGDGITRAADKTNDTRSWQGTWKLTSCVANGESQTADMQWIVDGDRYTIRLDGKAGQDPYPFKLDPSQKRIDVNHHDTPKGTFGGKLKGIYELKGDSLTVCYDLRGQRYPKSFNAERGSGQVLYQFQRQRR